MSKVIPFEPSHFDLIELREQEAAWMASDPKRLEKITALAAHGIGGTLIHDGRILAIIGWYELWPGHVAIWAFPSVYVKQYAMIYLRTVRQYLDVIETTLEPRRMQSEAYADELHDRWMRFLGFECETPNGMKNYAIDGRTMNLWARYPKGGA